MLKATATAGVSLDSPVADFPSVHDERKLNQRLSSQCTPKIDGDAAGGFAEQSAERGMEGKYERFSSVNEKNPHFSKDACGRFPCIRSLSAISAPVCFLIGTHLRASSRFRPDLPNALAIRIDPCYNPPIIEHEIFRAGCKSLPAVEPASRKA